LRCDELRARLDEQGSGGLLPAHREHGRACTSCAGAIRDDEALEALLRASPPSPQPGFDSAVMARVEATERVRQRLAGSRVSPWAGWWRGVLEEPAALVALTLAPVALALVALWPDTAAMLVGIVRDVSASWIASVWSVAASASAALGIVPATRAVLSALTLPVLVVAFFFGLQQVGEGLLAPGGASVTSDRRAQSESSSRRSAS
jgi:hypothetical protein